MVLRRFTNLLLVIAVAVAVLGSGAVWAVSEPTRSSAPDASVMQIDEPSFLGNRLKGETWLTDTNGKDFRVAEMMGKPLILLLSYYGCDGSCPTMNLELATVLARIKRFQLGKDYRVLTVSFDARDTPQTAREFATRSAGISAVPVGMQDGWRHAILKTGAGATDAVRDFAGEVGFRFFWSDAAGAFLHPNVLVFLTPEGRVARYIYGARMDPQTIELALVDADWERISSSTAVFDMVTGACFSYNYAEGRYQLNYSLLAGIGSLLLGLGLMGLGAWAYRKKVRKMHKVIREERHA